MKHIYQAWHEFYKSSKKNTQTRITVLLLSICFSSFSYGQNLPVVVDNSKFFPPVGTQFYNSCQVYSLVYYLKSYIWNREYNRDPKLLKNQFNPWFVWNTDVTPFQHYMGNDTAIDFLQSQGCATKDVFTASGEDQEILPTLTERESALSFKSKSLLVKSLPDTRTEDSMKQYLEELKDSLNKGVCFTISFPIYNVFNTMYTGHDFIYNYENYTAIGMIASHLAAVVGYNDTIMSKSGSRGALKIINSFGPLFGDKGYFYLDYKWLLNMTSWAFSTFFLQEDFSSQPSIDLSLNLSQAISGEDIQNGLYPFVDHLINRAGYPDCFFDYLSFDYHLSNVPLAIVKTVNGKKIDDIVFVNNHNHDGNHHMFVDLTSYTKSTDFKSMQVIVQDPVSATYIGEDNNVLFSYSRESKIGVAGSSVRMIGTNKYIVGKVQDLPDTTIVLENFFSTMISYALTPKRAEIIFINSCTSVLKRKLVTFSISDLFDAVSNIEVPEYTLKAYPNPMINNTTVEFSLSNRENVDLGIFDSLGRRVENITNQEYEAGTHQLVFDSKDLPDGIYMACLKTSAGIKTVKLIKSSGLN